MPNNSPGKNFAKFAARPLPWLLAGVATALYLRLFIPPGTPVLASQADEWIYLADSWRMLNGEAIYRDFFQFVAPGTQAFYFGLYKVFGVRAWIPNVMLILIGLAFTWLMVAISRRVLSGPDAYLPGALCVALSLFGALDATHHWYSTLAVMAATALAIERRSLIRLVGVGILCGLASFFTQTTGAGAAVGFLVFLVWECRHRRQPWRSLLAQVASLVASFLITLVALDAYFVWRAGLAQFLACTVGFVVKVYPSLHGSGLRVYTDYWGELPIWHSLDMWAEWGLVHAMLPAVYIVFLIRYSHEAEKRSEEHWDRMMLLNFVGLSLFASVAPAPSFLRLRIVCLPVALIVLVWILRTRERILNLLRACLWIGAAVLIMGKSIRYHAEPFQCLDLPSGRACIAQADSLAEIQWLASRTHPGELFFDMGWEPEVYPLLQLRNPTKALFLDSSNFTSPERVREVVEAMESRRVRYVLFRASYDDEQIKFSVPPSENHLGPFVENLRAHYHMVQSFADLDQVWERNGENCDSLN